MEFLTDKGFRAGYCGLPLASQVPYGADLMSSLSEFSVFISLLGFYSGILYPRGDVDASMVLNNLVHPIKFLKFLVSEAEKQSLSPKPTN